MKRRFAPSGHTPKLHVFSDLIKNFIRNMCDSDFGWLSELFIYKISDLFLTLIRIAKPWFTVDMNRRAHVDKQLIFMRSFLLHFSIRNRMTVKSGEVFVRTIILYQPKSSKCTQNETTISYSKHIRSLAHKHSPLSYNGFSLWTALCYDLYDKFMDYLHHFYGKIDRKR